jgi:hypothetical protein
MAEHIFDDLELPDYRIGQGVPQASGFTWDVAGDPVPDNGHAVGGVVYDAHALGGSVPPALEAHHRAPAAGNLFSVAKVANGDAVPREVIVTAR